MRKLLATGAPATVLAALRAHERSKEIRLRTLAQALLYEHAPRLGVGEAEREHLRRLLMAVAEDKKAPGTARDEALRVLIGNTWAGRDDWYEARLADPTLRHPSDGGTAYSPLGLAVRGRIRIDGCRG